MRKIRYAVETSLDGYIAGPNGEADWIVIESSFPAKVTLTIAFLI